jgi:hypothetical protein
MAYTTIDDPSAHFHTRLYSGNGSTQSITNDANAGNFKPDWLWIKERTSTSQHFLFDSTRGVGKYLHSDSTSLEGNDVHNTSFDSNGFGVGQQNGTNENSQTYVAWQWKANGGTTTTNTEGDTNVTLQANATAGFSIGTWDAGGSNAGAVGHGLGAAPEWIILKRRDGTSNWHVWHQSLGDGNNYVLLNSTGAKANDSYEYVSSIGSSTVSLAGGPGSYDEVAYFFRGIKGYSKFGSYTGNGSTDGPFVYTGFKPAWIMIKRTDTTNHWGITDNKRDPDNLTNEILLANDSGTGYSGSSIGYDILSNGFKIRNADSVDNTSGGTYIYMAFAEHPFVSSKGVPVTAR